MAYDFLCFSIPHVHGLKMNSYHQKHLKDERKKQLVTAESKLEHVKTYSLKREKEEDDDLVPGVPGTGIKIPLDSSGYTLAILLTIFTLLGSFTNFSG